MNGSGPARKYSMADIRWFADLLREHGDGIGPDQAAGMNRLVETLAFFERMGDADIERWIETNWRKE